MTNTTARDAALARFMSSPVEPGSDVAAMIQAAFAAGWEARDAHADLTVDGHTVELAARVQDGFLRTETYVGEQLVGLSMTHVCALSTDE